MSLPIEEQGGLSLLAGAWQLDVEVPDIASTESAEPFEASLPTSPVEVAKEEASPPPLSRILEALFFAAQEPLHADRLSKLIRGLTAAVIDTTVADLNQHYRQQGRPYCIVPQQAGYRMVLRTSFRPLLEQLYGSIKEARFSQLAIETLAIVGYCQPVDEAAIEVILGQTCNSALRQLVRRGMVQLVNHTEKDERQYVTTNRFLEFFQLSKVEDLPRADDLERL